MTGPRTYRFSPPDRTGWLLGLGGSQVAVLGAAVVLAVVLASGHAALPVLAAPIVIGTALAFTRVGGQPLLDAAPPALSWMARRARRQHRWLAPLPLPGEGLTPPLPPCLAGQVLLDAEGIAVVCDLKTGRYAATVRVTGAGFGLAERHEQERLLAAWGDALAPFCRDRGPVVAVRWSEWAAPAGIEEQLAFLAEHGNEDPDDPAVVSYRQLLATAGPLGTRHETLLTVVVNGDRLTVGAKGKGARDRAAVDALLSEIHLFTGRLDTAGLTVSAPLSPEELGRALRIRIDPGALAGLDRRGRSLGQLAGVVAPQHAGPLAAEARWSAWRADGAWHRAFWMSDWPRLDVGPAWLADLLLAHVGVRSVSVWCEPVAPRTSRRAIERAAAKLDADEDHRHHIGLRVGASHRRAQTAVVDREAELVAGYPEFTYAGLVTVTAPHHDGLDAASAEVIQVAAAAGIDLRPLHGRHDIAVAATLPLARGLTPRLTT